AAVRLPRSEYGHSDSIFGPGVGANKRQPVGPATHGHHQAALANLYKLLRLTQCPQVEWVVAGVVFAVRPRCDLCHWHLLSLSAERARRWSTVHHRAVLLDINLVVQRVCNRCAHTDGVKTLAAHAGFSRI